MIDDAGVIEGLNVFVILLAMGCVFLIGPKGFQSEARLPLQQFVCAYVLRFMLSILLYQFGLGAVVGDEDARWNWLRGVALHARWDRESIGLLQLPTVLGAAFEGKNQGYYYLLATQYHLLGTTSRLTSAAFCGFCGALIVVLGYRIALEHFSAGVARRVGWWLCFFPSMIIWSAQTLKEPLVILLEALALYGSLRLCCRGLSLRYVLLCTMAIVALLAFRFYAAYIVGLAVFSALLGAVFHRRYSVIAVLPLVLVLFLLVRPTQVISPHEAELKRFNLDVAESFRHNVSAGGARYGAGSGVETEDIRTPEGLVRGTAIGAAHLLLAPFPWQLSVGSTRMLLTAPELLFWWWLFFAGVVPGLRSVVRHRLADVAPILLFLLGFGLLYSLTFGNVGLVFRQRAQLLPWLLVFAAVGLEQRALSSIAVREMRRER